MADSPRTAPDFSRPIEALKACHERLRSQCAALRELMDRVRELGCDAQAQQLAAGVMRYFDTAARHHHADEEEDLLPRMVAAASMGRGLRITRLVADLIREHRELHWAWSRLRTVLQEIAAGERAALDPRAVNRFARLYTAHIRFEEDSVFPLAETLLSSEDFAAIGASMAQRRGGARC